MDKINELLDKERITIDKIEAPSELEDILRDKLNNHQPKKKKKYRWMINVAAVLLLVSIIGFNYDTLAYYGKKMLGYDEVMSQTLKDLNELGKGQTIDKSYTFDNGVTYTLDGLMLDDNYLLVFYTIKAPDELLMDNSSTYAGVKGVFSKLEMKSAHGIKEEVDDGFIKKVINKFDPPKFFEKNFTFNAVIVKRGGIREVGKIEFTLDRNKAMGHTLKKNINQSIKVGKQKITFDSIQVSPISTVIKGEIKDFAIEEIKGQRIGIRGANLNLELIANGVKVAWQEGGIITNMDGTTFSFDFDTLPTNLEKLEIKLVSYTTDYPVNVQYELDKGKTEESIKILNQDIVINDVYEENDYTGVTFTSDDSTVLTDVYLNVDGKQIPFEWKTDYNQPEGSKTLLTRTIFFPKTGTELELDIQRIQYEATYDKTINIPVE